MSEAAPVTTARYKPGPWVGMAAAGMWVVADLDPRDPVVEACWALVTEAEIVEDFAAGGAPLELRAGQGSFHDAKVDRFETIRLRLWSNKSRRARRAYRELAVIRLATCPGRRCPRSGTLGRIRMRNTMLRIRRRRVTCRRAGVAGSIRSCCGPCNARRGLP